MLLVLHLVPLLKDPFNELVNRHVKELNIKNRTYYFFNDIINIEIFYSGLLNIEKISYKNIDTYYIGYIPIKKIDDYENIHSVNPLYLITGEVDGHIEEKNGSKYLVFDSTGENNEILTKYAELWDGIKILKILTPGY